MVAMMWQHASGVDVEFFDGIVIGSLHVSDIGPSPPDCRESRFHGSSFACARTYVCEVTDEKM
jgi:hypothetical protein